MCISTIEGAFLSKVCELISPLSSCQQMRHYQFQILRLANTNQCLLHFFWNITLFRDVDLFKHYTRTQFQIHKKQKEKIDLKEIAFIFYLRCGCKGKRVCRPYTLLRDVNMSYLQRHCMLLDLLTRNCYSSFSGIPVLRLVYWELFPAAFCSSWKTNSEAKQKGYVGWGRFFTI